MVESQLSDLRSLLQSVDTDLRPHLQPSLHTITTQVSDLHPLLYHSQLSAINKYWSSAIHDTPADLHVIQSRISRLPSLLHPVDLALHPQLQPVQSVGDAHVDNLRAMSARLLDLNAFTDILHEASIIHNMWNSKYDAPTFVTTLQSHLSTLTARLMSIKTGSFPHLRVMQAAAQAQLVRLQSDLDRLSQIQ